MVGNNSVYTQIQRRGRRSNPPSPTSPTFTRRQAEKHDVYLHTSSPAEATSGSAGGESPVVDINLPSPTFDLSSASPISPRKDVRCLTNHRPARASDEYIQHRRPPSRESARAATSATSSSTYTKPYSHSHTPMSSPSPPSGTGRPSFEHLGSGAHLQEWRSRFHDQQGPTLRNFSTSSIPTVRSTFEDSSSVRHPAPKKSRLNLLNPMSLLARRRSSQNSRGEDADLTVNTSGVAPLPAGSVSIRATRTVDFSAPKPRRIYSYNDVSDGESSPVVESYQGLQYDGKAPDTRHLPLSPGKPPSQPPQRLPLFKEHFNDDRPALQPGMTSYLHSLATTDAFQVDPAPSDMPAFAKRLPIRIPEAVVSGGSHRNQSTELQDQAQSVLQINTSARGAKEAQPFPSPPTPPPKAPATPPSPVLDLPHTSQLPKHMTSTSSRFSFQIGEHGSFNQERLLEEKHKQHQMSKKLADIPGETEPDEDDFGDYDFDDDGLEERIPGVNADSEEDDLQEPTSGVKIDDDAEDVREHSVLTRNVEDAIKQSDGFEEFHFTPRLVAFTPADAPLISQSTPRDDEGQRIGVADTKICSDAFLSDLSQQKPNGFDHGARPSGLGIMAALGSSVPEKVGPRQPSMQTRASFEEDDMYFDDGDFDGHYDQADENFDEEIFDDETGKIHDIPAENAKRLESARRVSAFASDRPPRQTLLPDDRRGVTKPDQESAFLSSQTYAPAFEDLSAKWEADAGAHNSLTEGNLAAYHDALVSAANNAAAKGKFSRNVSFSQVSEDQSSQSQLGGSHHGITSDESRISQNVCQSGVADGDGFPFDKEEYDDDLMIAEANAEVLENDDDGFYGQEFGFYARAHGKDSSDLTIGGYFGPRGSNGIKRSHSAKANFQEPSLTPITERSEWSTRNSIASLHIPNFPGSTNSIPSPSITQLIELESSPFDDEMTYRALAKLRRGAFGSSSTSVNSLGGGGHSGSSPLAHITSQRTSTNEPYHKLSSSIHSLTDSVGIPESEEEDGDPYELPTLTQSTPRKRNSDPSPAILQQTQNPVSPSLDAIESGKAHHSRTSSGTGSVSYVRDSGGRWLLERRRTGDGGELEIIGREYVAGARI